MIQLNEMKVGDLVRAEYDGQLWEGHITRIDHQEGLVSVNTRVKEFWFIPEQLFPIPICEESMLQLHFDKEVAEDGSICFMKNAVKLEAPAGNFSQLYMWYQNQKRAISNIRYIHQLQNQFADFQIGL